MRKLAIISLLWLPLIAQSRPVPPPGVAVSPEDRAELESGLRRLESAIRGLRSTAPANLLPDVQIFQEAVRYALTYNEFFKPEEVARGKELLRQGLERAAQLAAGKAPWTTASGLIVRGYVSRIDNSVQPYGLVVPAGYTPSPHRWRLDAWFHGRNETLSEVNFLYDRQRNPGEFTPRAAIVLHLYGRYCNANKFAGEIDFFEALEAVKREYAIDENRIVVRGFSMGGAAAWHIAAHHAGEWAAAAPGAGFSETPEFLRVFANEKIAPAAWEQKLWRLYNATDYAANFYNLPVVAYSGEIDRQKQAADIMAKALGEEGMSLTHIIGPQTGHKYHPDSKIAIERALDSIAARGRDPYPRKLRFTTFTLAYNRMKWLTVDGLDRHWERARVEADIRDDGSVDVRLSNVDAFTLAFGPGGAPFEPNRSTVVAVNGQRLTVPGPATDRSWSARFHRAGSQWTPGPGADRIRKRHGLQGPIDDAFMDSFLFVTPTGSPGFSQTAKWVETEQQRAITDWRRQYRGEAQVKPDSEVTDADIASRNLVLWGDPVSNRILARIADRLPLRWPGGSKALILIYPNPLNPKRYVVLNSGATQRAYDYLNNARQVPRLPDYAIVETGTPADDRYPGKILEAGLFDENWKLAVAN